MYRESSAQKLRKSRGTMMVAKEPDNATKVHSFGFDILALALWSLGWARIDDFH
jgi:hypothetical protein